MKQTTNITEEHQKAFNALRNEAYSNFCLFSCFVNGEPSSAIVCITYDDDNDDVLITPLFVAVTTGMTLENHDGEEPTD